MKQTTIQIRHDKSNFLPKRQFLDSSKPKEFAHNNCKFNENGGKFSKRVENTLGKGKIGYEKFLLFPNYL